MALFFPIIGYPPCQRSRDPSLWPYDLQWVLPCGRTLTFASTLGHVTSSGQWDGKIAFNGCPVPFSFPGLFLLFHLTCKCHTLDRGCSFSLTASTPWNFATLSFSIIQAYLRWFSRRSCRNLNPIPKPHKFVNLLWNCDLFNKSK